MRDTDTPCGSAPLEPESRVRESARGTPVVSGGRVWYLADYVTDRAPVWDRLFDGNCLRGSYSEFDVRAAAARTLVRNYDLAPDEAAAVVVGAELDDLTHAVETALFGPEKAYRSYSDWVASALLANGIDPDSVPPDLLRPVLDQLVMTGRAVPAAKFVSAAEAAEFFRGQA